VGWKHLDKPARGKGHGGPAKGPGLGGEAKGASAPKDRPQFQPGNTASANRIGGSTYRRLSREERIGVLTEKAFDLLESAEQEGVRMSMTQYLLNREMGTPGPAVTEPLGGGAVRIVVENAPESNAED
jgi:hypothetical protein